MPISTQRAFSFIKCCKDWIGVNPSSSLVRGLWKIDSLDSSEVLGVFPFFLSLISYHKALVMQGGWHMAFMNKSTSSDQSSRSSYGSRLSRLSMNSSKS